MSTEAEAQARILRALEHIQRAQGELGRAQGELSSIIGMAPDWQRLGKWYRLEGRRTKKAWRVP